MVNHDSLEKELKEDYVSLSNFISFIILISYIFPYLEMSKFVQITLIVILVISISIRVLDIGGILFLLEKTNEQVLNKKNVTSSIDLINSLFKREVILLNVFAVIIGVCNVLISSFVLIYLYQKINSKFLLFFLKDQLLLVFAVILTAMLISYVSRFLLVKIRYFNRHCLYVFKKLNCLISFIKR